MMFKNLFRKILPILIISIFPILSTNDTPIVDRIFETGDMQLIDEDNDGCTVGVAMGNATTDGRPFSWKNRDGSGRHFVWYEVSGGTYDYLAMGTDAGLKMGVNEAGLSLQNSLCTDIPSDGYTYDNNTAFKAYSLSEFGSVQDARQSIIEDTSGIEDHWPPPAICVNFSDAHGFASTFELGGEVYYEYDPTNPTRLAQFPKQFVVRANASHKNTDHTDDESTGGNRYIVARDDMQSIADNEGLNVSNWIKQVSRHGEPGVDKVEMPSRIDTRGVMLVHGVNQGEDPQIVTGWIALGNPDYTGFLPVWTAQQDNLSPWVTSSDSTNSIAGLSDQLLTKRDDQHYDEYINSLIRLVEDNIIEAVSAARSRWLTGEFVLDEAVRIHTEAANSLWHTMNSLNAGDGRNLNITPNLSAINAAQNGLQVAFSSISSDDDGSIVAYEWDFGDGSSSSSASPVHTYDSGGIYLVRCRVVDNAGSRNSRWKYIEILNGNQPPIVYAGEDQTVFVDENIILSGSVSDDGLPNPPAMVSTLWSQVNGPGVVTFDDASATETTASFSTDGVYVLRLTADDSEFTASDEVSITVITSLLTTIEVQVGVSSDDAEECMGNNLVYLTSSDLELIRDDNPGGGSLCTGNQEVGIRFNNVSIPRGAAISNAYIQFQVDETSSEPTTLTIYGQDSDSATTYVSSTGDISSRPRTTAFSDWTPSAWTSTGASGPDQRTPNIASIIQEIVDRSGWSAGNAMAFIIAGSGQRIAESYNGYQNGAPLLHVEYNLTDNQSPVVSISTPADGAVFDEGEQITFTGTAADTEDGDLTASLEWHSDLDGLIDSGGNFTTSSLSVGTHAITATVTDSGSSSGSDQISISVLPFNTAPTVSISTPADGAVFDQGDQITFTGTASDTEDGDLTASLEWQSDLDGPIGSGGNFTSSNLSVGTHTITATVTDSGGASGSDHISIIINQSQGSIVTLEVRVTGGTDDAEECLVNNLVYLTSSDLELVRDDNPGGGSLCEGDQEVGIRFNNVSIPKGATITNAYIQFQVDETSSESTNLTIFGQDSDEAVTFTSTSGDISSRPRTTAFSNWTPAAWTVVGASGADQRTPNITSIIQEIVGRSGWSDGNAIVFLIEGNGQRIAESYNGTQNGAPLLHVEYLLPINQSPAISITAPADGAVFDAGYQISFAGTATDTEDGDLSASLTWLSDPDGPIGTGASFSTSDLSVGFSDDL